MNIVYAMNKNVYRLAMVSFASLLVNNKKEKIALYILCSKLPKYIVNNFNKLKSIRDFTLNVIEVDPKDFNNLPIGWLTIETWYRLKLDQLLPNESRALYLDCDTLVRKDISEIYNREMSDNDIIAAREGNWKTLVTPESGWYFNAGVMMCNLDNWRSHKLSQMLFENAYKYAKENFLKFMDQDVFNITCDNSKMSFKPGDVFLTWNDDGANEHSIIHFIGPKPNHPMCVNKEYQKEWWEYAKIAKQYYPLRLSYYINCCKIKFNEVKKYIFSINKDDARITFYVLGIKISRKIKNIN